MKPVISAYDFAEALSGVSAYRFGAKAQTTAAALRALADAIDRGEAIVQKAVVSSTAEPEDFTLTELHLTYAEGERKPPAEGG